MGEPLEEGRMHVLVWAGASGEALGSLTSDPGTQPPGSALFLSIMWPWTATHYTTSYLCLENSDAQWAWEDLGMPPERHSLPGSIPAALTIPEAPVSLSQGAHFTSWSVAGVGGHLGGYGLDSKCDLKSVRNVSEDGDCGGGQEAQLGFRGFHDRAAGRWVMGPLRHQGRRGSN